VGERSEYVGDVAADRMARRGCSRQARHSAGLAKDEAQCGAGITAMLEKVSDSGAVRALTYASALPRATTSKGTMMVTQLYIGFVALVFCLAGDVYVRFSK
jgi:hypothetical protein